MKKAFVIILGLLSTACADNIVEDEALNSSIAQTNAVSTKLNTDDILKNWKELETEIDNFINNNQEDKDMLLAQKRQIEKRIISPEKAIIEYQTLYNFLQAELDKYKGYFEYDKLGKARQELAKGNEYYAMKLLKERHNASKGNTDFAESFASAITKTFVESVDFKTLYENTLKLDEDDLNKGTPNVASRLNNLGNFYLNRNKYSEAEQFFKKALEMKEGALGKDHIDVAVALNNLAVLYHSQGRYKDAEPLLKKSLEIDEKNLDKDHPDIATKVSNLAGIYYSQGKYSEAEHLHKRTLAAREKNLGESHIKVA